VKTIYAILVIALTSAPAAVSAQGNDSATGGATDRAAPESVQIGAGSTSNVTTGSSGAKQPAGKTAQPLGTSMPWPPRSEPFSLPGSLPLQRPARLRCDVIADGNARDRCELRSKKRDD
jgi:hypothetical protein